MDDNVHSGRLNQLKAFFLCVVSIFFQQGLALFYFWTGKTMKASRKPTHHLRKQLALNPVHVSLFAHLFHIRRGFFRSQPSSFFPPHSVSWNVRIHKYGNNMGLPATSGGIWSGCNATGVNNMDNLMPAGRISSSSDAEFRTRMPANFWPATDSVGLLALKGIFLFYQR